MIALTCGRGRFLNAWWTWIGQFDEVRQVPDLQRWQRLLSPSAMPFLMHLPVPAIVKFQHVKRMLASIAGSASTVIWAEPRSA